MEDWPGQAVAMASDGMSHDRVARRLLGAGAGPIEALKALRSLGVPLADGKRRVDGALPADERAANERLRATLAAYVEDDV